jgi:hypothetical protein
MNTWIFVAEDEYWIVNSEKFMYSKKKWIVNSECIHIHYSRELIHYSLAIHLRWMFKGAYGSHTRPSGSPSVSFFNRKSAYFCQIFENFWKCMRVSEILSSETI